MARRRIAIFGGGIAGLTLACALDPHRFDVTLYEAQPERSESGSALGLWGAARHALHDVGALPTLGERPTQGALHRIDGRRLLPLRGGGPLMVERPALLSALERAVPREVHREQLEVTDPSTLQADLIVGADGVRSRVRGLIEPVAAERLATPYLALRGIAPNPPEPSTVGEYWGGGLLFGIVPTSGGKTYWFSTHRSELREPLDLRAALTETRHQFRAAAPTVRQLLLDAGGETLATRLWVAPPMRSYVRDRYVVVGDAAHAMLPNLGRGACSAIIDAASLAATLNRGRDLRIWQARRVPATQLARASSAALMKVAVRQAKAPIGDR